MKRLLFSVILLNIAIQVSAQVNSVIGTWNSSHDVHLVKLKFDSAGMVHRLFSGDVANIHREGHYKLSHDTIYVSYDSLTVEEMKSNKLASQPILRDTFFIINKNKIKVNRGVFIYNIERDEPIFNVDNNGVLNYKARTFGDDFYLSHYRFKQWVIIDTLTSEGNEYLTVKDYKLPQVSGENNYRITVANKRVRSFKVNSSLPVVVLASRNVSDKIEFSSETIYEVFDSYGRLKLRGTGKTVDCSKLKSGKYYVNFDSQMAEIKKK